MRFLTSADNGKTLCLRNALLPVLGVQAQAEQKRFPAAGTLFGAAHAGGKISGDARSRCAFAPASAAWQESRCGDGK